MAKMSEIVEGAVFGRLSVTGERPTKVWNERKKRYEAHIAVRCECGTDLTTRVDSLGGAVLSCGCLNRENTAKKGKANATHGMTGTPTYKSWSNMWDRCTRETNEKYHLYKDRAPPEAWRSFETFLADMGVKPEGHSIERVDNSRPYSKDNCVWLPVEQQYRNKTKNLIVVKAGVEHLLTDACRLEGLNEKTVRSRIYTGWTIQEALGDGWSWKEADRGQKIEENGKAYVRPDRL